MGIAGLLMGFVLSMHVHLLICNGTVSAGQDAWEREIEVSPFPLSSPIIKKVYHSLMFNLFWCVEGSPLGKRRVERWASKSARLCPSKSPFHATTSVYLFSLDPCLEPSPISNRYKIASGQLLTRLYIWPVWNFCQFLRTCEKWKRKKTKNQTIIRYKNLSGSFLMATSTVLRLLKYWLND